MSEMSVYVGIDVSKAELEVAVGGDTRGSQNQQERGSLGRRTRLATPRSGVR